MELVVLIITFLTLALSIVLVKLYIIRPLEDAKRFELFDLRDELAMLAMEGKVEEKSREFSFLINFINCEIYSIGKSFSITRYLKAVIIPTLEKENKFKLTIDKINENEYLKPIAAKAFSSSIKWMEKKIKVLQVILLVCYLPLKILDQTIKAVRALNPEREKIYSPYVEQKVFYANMSKKFDKYCEIVEPVIS